MHPQNAEVGNGQTRHEQGQGLYTIIQKPSARIGSIRQKISRVWPIFDEQKEMMNFYAEQKI